MQNQLNAQLRDIRALWISKLETFFKKWVNPGLFFIYFVFSNTLKNLQQIHMWKNVYPIYGAGIKTHDLWNLSLLP